MCLAGFRLLFYLTWWKGPIMSGRKWWEWNKAAPSCLWQLLWESYRNLSPCVAEPLAAGQREADGFRAPERSRGSNDWWLPAPCTICSSNFFTPTLFYLLFLEGKELRRGGKVHAELLFSPVALESECRGKLKESPVKTATEMIFLSVHGFALLMVSC